MENVKNKKISAAIAEIEKRNPGNLYQVRKGQPDARSPKGYYLYVVVSHGVEVSGTYGSIVHHARSLKGLIEYINS